MVVIVIKMRASTRIVFIEILIVFQRACYVFLLSPTVTFIGNNVKGAYYQVKVDLKMFSVPTDGALRDRET